MKIVKILGGCGNQMFQYALYLSLKQTFPEMNVKIDLSCFNGYPLHNGFEIDKIFDVQPERATKKDLLRIAYPWYHYRLWQLGKRILPLRKTMCREAADFSLEKDIFLLNENKYYDGYWQNEFYFKKIRNEILQVFQFPDFSDSRNVEQSKKINSSESVSIHIRRGDYINHPLLGNICSKKYYLKAIDYIKKHVESPRFFVFSDDIEWSQSELQDYWGRDNVEYINWNKGKSSYVDMQLMSLCKHNIIANSSFSWWGAWLNQNDQKIVIAPFRWMNCPMANDPVPDSWIKI